MSNKNWLEDMKDSTVYWVVGLTWLIGLTVIGLINKGVIL